MKHDLKSLLLFLMISLSVNIHAQQSSQATFTVKGELVDSLTNDGEPYATIRIALAKNPTQPVRLAVTSTNGKFSEKLKEAGKYLISFSSVGKNTVQRDFTLSESKPTVDLGTIMIAESTEMLKGVEVVAQKPLVKAEVDKVT